MFLLEHIEKFIGDHRRAISEPDKLLETIREESKRRDPVGKFDSCQADEWLGDELAREFFRLVETNEAYLNISTTWVLSHPRP
jgi:hypothetical protein